MDEGFNNVDERRGLMNEELDRWLEDLIDFGGSEGSMEALCLKYGWRA